MALPLGDITLSANNASRSNCTAATTPAAATRQLTIFDALSAAQRRVKRQRKSLLSSPGQENSDPSSLVDNTDTKAVKKPRTSTPRLSQTTQQQQQQQQQQQLVQTSTCQPSLRRRGPVDTLRQGFGLVSSHSALRMRHCGAFAAHNISTAGRLENLVSPASSVFRLYGEDSTQIGVLPLACKYAKTPSMRGRLALVDEGGYISLFDTANFKASGSDNDDGERLVPQARWRGHKSTIFDVEWSSDDARLLTASADETSRLWDHERQVLLGEFRGHTQTVRAVSWRPGDPSCFSSASRDGSIMMWDVRCNKASVDGGYSHRPVNIVRNAHHNVQLSGATHRRKSSVPGGSVTGIQHLRHNTNLVASAGSTSEIVKYWDIRISAPTRASSLPTPVASSLLLSSARRPRGISSLTLDPDGTRLYAACNDNRVHVHNALAPGYPVTQLTAPEFECHSFNVGTSMSPCGRFLAAGSTSGSVVVWELDRYGFNGGNHKVVLHGHAKEAGCVAWYPGKERTQIVTCGDDGIMRVWDLNAHLAGEGKADPMKRCRWGLATMAVQTPTGS